MMQDNEHRLCAGAEEAVTDGRRGGWNGTDGMRKIGVTGGIGAGKSQVMDYLEKRWGARIIRLDEISRAFLEKDGLLYQDTIGLFGSKIVRKDGSLDRAGIAEIIFADEGFREKLDAMIHPAVRRETERLFREYEKEGVSLCAVEAALLIEEHYDEICDEMWYIYASEKIRAMRLAADRHYDGKRIRGAFSRQLSEGEFRKHADFVIDNNGEFSDTEKQIDKRLSV